MGMLSYEELLTSVADADGDVKVSALMEAMGVALEGVELTDLEGVQLGVYVNHVKTSLVARLLLDEPAIREFEASVAFEQMRALYELVLNREEKDGSGSVQTVSPAVD